MSRALSHIHHLMNAMTKDSFSQLNFLMATMSQTMASQLGSNQTTRCRRRLSHLGLRVGLLHPLSLHHLKGDRLGGDTLNILSHHLMTLIKGTKPGVV